MNSLPSNFIGARGARCARRAHRYNGPSRATLAGAVLAALMSMSLESNASGAAMASAFDEGMLRARGISPEFANSFAEAPRFAPGLQSLALVVNGQRHGRVNARVDSDGNVCFDSSLLTAARVREPDAQWRSIDSNCYDLRGAYPEMVAEPQPESLTLGLVLPTAALLPAAREKGNFDRGGIAALLNYDLLYLNNEFGDRRSHYWSARTEAGFNAGDWMFRSRQIQTSRDGRRHGSHLEAYAERTFVDQQLTLQAGQVTMFNPILAGARIDGVQVSTELTLAAQNESGARIEGIASSRARVEVRQSGTLVHSTVVPPGHFVLGDIRGLTGRTDLQVTIFEEDGAERSFIVPYALATPVVQTPGFVIAAGRLRDVHPLGADGPRQGNEDTWVASAGWTGNVGRRLTAGMGALLASDYQAVGVSAGGNPWAGGQAQVTLQHARSRGDRTLQGQQLDLAFSQRLIDSWSINTTASRRTEGFRDLLESPRLRGEVSARGMPYKAQYSVASSWSQPVLGGLSLGYSRTERFDGGSTGRGVASWNRQFGDTSLSLTAEWAMGSSQYTQGNSIYASLSVPLGKAHRVRASARRTDAGTRTGVEASGRLSDQVSYRSSLYRDGHNGTNQASAGLSALPRYAQLEANYSRLGGNQRSLQAGARGGVAIHRQGVTASPYPIRDTFGVVSVAGLPGIKVNTPAGPVWTDAKGRAVLPQVAPFRDSVVQIDTTSLPRNVELGSGISTLSLARGAVQHISMEASRTRRALLSVASVDGDGLPTGAPVMDDSGQLITLVQAGSTVFLSSVDADQRYWVTLPDQQRCLLEFTMPDKDSLDAFFERVQATCRPE